jgi:hypothetical protein
VSPRSTTPAPARNWPRRCATYRRRRRPPPPPEEVRKAKSEERRGRIRRFRAELASFVGPNAVCIGIWAAAGHDRFWPRWVLLFTGVGFITSVIKGFDASHKEKKAAKSRT